MYMRITRGRWEPRKGANVQRLVEERILPAWQKLPGFRGLYSAFDRTNPGRGITDSLWDTQVQAQGARDALGGIVSEITSLGVELEPGEVHEVVVQA